MSFIDQKILLISLNIISLIQYFYKVFFSNSLMTNISHFFRKKRRTRISPFLRALIQYLLGGNSHFGPWMCNE